MACVGTRGKLCFTAGETISIDNEFLDDDGNFIPLDGATIEAQLLESTTSVIKTLDWTVTPIDLSVGTFNLSLTDIQSQTLLPLPSSEGEVNEKSYVTDIKVTYSDSTIDFIGGLDIAIKQNAIR